MRSIPALAGWEALCRFSRLGPLHFLTQKDYLLPDYIYENKVESL
jgi:hypothetical protein